MLSVLIIAFLKMYNTQWQSKREVNKAGRIKDLYAPTGIFVAASDGRIKIQPIYFYSIHIYSCKRVSCIKLEKVIHGLHGIQVIHIEDLYSKWIVFCFEFWCICNIRQVCMLIFLSFVAWYKYYSVIGTVIYTII